MRMTEKDTSSGRDIREYLCDCCGHTDWEERGPALWQILHDDREEFLAAQTAKAKVAESWRDSKGSLWSRLQAWVVRGR
jgi:hypothetical protein